MASFLKNHPFAVAAHFDRSLVLTFAVPKAEVERLIPYPLTPDTFNDKWAFVAVAMVQTRHLRPKGFPKFLGNSFFLTGYRIFVRYKNERERNLRGLFILKSETDKKKMEYIGNVFTHYRYTTTDIQVSKQDKVETIRSYRSKFAIRLNTEQNEVALPETSPFDSWKEARRFAGPLPFTFTCNEREKTVLIVEGVRSNWKPQPVEVIDQQFAFFEQMGIQSPVFASAFQVSNIPYYWKKGKIETWK